MTGLDPTLSFDPTSLVQTLSDPRLEHPEREPHSGVQLPSGFFFFVMFDQVYVFYSRSTAGSGKILEEERRTCSHTTPCFN